MKLDSHHWILLVFIITLTYLSFYFPLINYEALPDTMPIHFNLMGEADKWAPKNYASVLMGPIILVIVIVPMLVITWYIASVGDARKVINLPQAKLAKISLELAEEVRQITVLHMLIILSLVVSMIFIITLNQILIALGQPTNLAKFMIGVTLLLVGDSIYLAWKTISLTRI